MTAKFFSGDCVVTEELVTAAGELVHQRRADDLRQRSASDRGRQAVIAKFRASGFEPEGTPSTLCLDPGDRRRLQRHRRQNSAKAAEWLKVARRRHRDGQKAWDQKGDLKVSDYVVYQWDDKGKYHQL